MTAAHCSCRNHCGTEQPGQRAASRKTGRKTSIEKLELSPNLVNNVVGSAFRLGSASSCSATCIWFVDLAPVLYFGGPVAHRSAPQTRSGFAGSRPDPNRPYKRRPPFKRSRTHFLAQRQSNCRKCALNCAGWRTDVELIQSLSAWRRCGFVQNAAKCVADQEHEANATQGTSSCSMSAKIPSTQASNWFGIFDSVRAHMVDTEQRKPRPRTASECRR